MSRLTLVHCVAWTTGARWRRYCVVLLTNSPGGAAANQRTTCVVRQHPVCGAAPCRACAGPALTTVPRFADRRGSAEYMSASDNHQWDAGQSFNLMVTDPFTQKLEVKLCVSAASGTRAVGAPCLTLSCTGCRCGQVGPQEHAQGLAEGHMHVRHPPPCCEHACAAHPGRRTARTRQRHCRADVHAVREGRRREQGRPLSRGHGRFGPDQCAYWCYAGWWKCASSVGLTKAT